MHANKFVELVVLHTGVDLVVLHTGIMVRKLDHKVKTPRRKVLRQKKFHSLKYIIADLKDKRLIRSKPAELIASTFTGLKLSIIENKLRNKDRTAKG